MSRFKLHRIVKASDMDRDFIRVGVVGEGKRRTAGQAEASPGYRRGTTLGGFPGQPLQAGNRHPSEHSEGAASCAPTHIAVAVMHTWSDAYPISNLATQASAPVLCG
jgi:hypothetical protein